MRTAPLTSLFKGLCAGGLWLASVSGPASAEGAAAAPTQGAKTVLELFTSQGCSSCPPADALLHKYAQRSDVIALSMPVDYWDYLGWKDTFASPKNTARQKAYAKVRGDGRVYTPQVVVNGVTHAVGSSAREIDAAIKETAAKLPGRVPVSVRVEGNHLVVEAGEGSAVPGEDATIWLAVIQKEGEVPVSAGENRGKSLKYLNIVRELTPIGMWNGKPAHFELMKDAVKLPDTQSCAVLVQSGKAGPIIGAAMLESF